MKLSNVEQRKQYLLTPEQLFNHQGFQNIQIDEGKSDFNLNLYITINKFDINKLTLYFTLSVQ